MSCKKNKSVTEVENTGAYFIVLEKGCHLHVLFGKEIHFFPLYGHQQQFTLQSEFVRNFRTGVLFRNGNTYEYSSDSNRTIIDWYVLRIVWNHHFSSFTIDWNERQPFSDWRGKNSTQVDAHTVVEGCQMATVLLSLKTLMEMPQITGIMDVRIDGPWVFDLKHGSDCRHYDVERRDKHCCQSFSENVKRVQWSWCNL